MPLIIDFIKIIIVNIYTTMSLLKLSALMPSGYYDISSLFALLIRIVISTELSTGLPYLFARIEK